MVLPTDDMRCIKLVAGVSSPDGDEGAIQGAQYALVRRKRPTCPSR